MNSAGDATSSRHRSERSATKELRWPHFGFTVLLSILFLTFLDNTVISAMLSNVQSALHSGVSQLQWVVGGYALAFASPMLISGSLGDSYGRKKVMLIGVGIFWVGSLVSALATSSNELVIGRVIMGVGAAASEPDTLSMIRHIYPESRQRARALGTGRRYRVWRWPWGRCSAECWWACGLGAVFWFNLAFRCVALERRNLLARERKSSAQTTRLCEIRPGGTHLGHRNLCHHRW